MSNDSMQYETFYEEYNKYRKKRYRIMEVLAGINGILIALLTLYCVVVGGWQFIRILLGENFYLTQRAKIGIVLIVLLVILIWIQFIVFSEYKMRIFNQVVTYSYTNNEIYYDYQVCAHIRRIPFHVHINLETITGYHVFKDKILVSGKFHMIDSRHRSKYKKTCILHCSFQNQEHLIQLLNTKTDNKRHQSMMFHYRMKKWGTSVSLVLIGALFTVATIINIHDIHKNKMLRELEQRYNTDFVVENVTSYETDGMFGPVTNYRADAYKKDEPEIPFKVDLVVSGEIYEDYAWALYGKQCMSNVDSFLKKIDIIESYKLHDYHDHMENSVQDISSYEAYIKSNPPRINYDVTFKDLPVDELAVKIKDVLDSCKYANIELYFDFKYNGVEGSIYSSDCEQDIKEELQGVRPGDNN